MDCVGATPAFWLLCMVYVVYMLNQWSNSYYIGSGTTPDISALLLFYFYQRIIYVDPGSSFPASKERLGSFAGITENVSDAVKFLVLNDDTH
jgi:hypothetical protein